MKRTTNIKRNARVRRTAVVVDDVADIDLSELTKEFEFKWRVQSFSKFKAQATCVPYCDSRQVQDVLDRVCGPENWQDKYHDVDGVTFCAIGIKLNGEWVWKSDCGVNEQRDKSIAIKGESSDAFKRAAVKWGIGRFLYSMRMYTLDANKKKEDGDKSWNLYCVDDKKNKIADWYITDYINGKRGSAKAVPAADPTAKGDEASQELRKLETWLSKYSDERVIKALSWIGFEKSKSEYKNNGVADVPRVKFGDLCNLVKITGYDEEIFDMCLDGFGYHSIIEGGVEEMLNAGTIDKVRDECELVKNQDSSDA